VKERRNCRFFPEDWDATRDHVVWMAYYETVKREKSAIESTRTTECPVSRITPDIQWLHGQFQSNRLAVKAGGSLYGPVSGSWPAWWAQTSEICNLAASEANAAIGISD